MPINPAITETERSLASPFPHGGLTIIHNPLMADSHSGATLKPVHKEVKASTACEPWLAGNPITGDIRMNMQTTVTAELIIRGMD
jgi:hypothetical protein